jgi:hypothetical protein
MLSFSYRRQYDLLPTSDHIKSYRNYRYKRKTSFHPKQEFSECLRFETLLEPRSRTTFDYFPDRRRVLI